MDMRNIGSASSGGSDTTGSAPVRDGASRPRSSTVTSNHQLAEGPGSAAAANKNNNVNGNSSGAGSSVHQPIKCPRCDSLNTKFCYFNNYSQTQPRHFCKTCRRYWTEGGALRNVPVGGGCRKNKRVKQRRLMNLGGAAAAGLLDPSALIDPESTSNMLARLSGCSGSSNSSPFPNFGRPGGAASCCGNVDDTGTHLLNIAFARFQESIRLRAAQSSSDQSPENSPYFDMGFPALVHSCKQPASAPSCSCGACGSTGTCARANHSLHHHHAAAGGCSSGGLISTALDASLGFSHSLPVKVDHHHDMSCMGDFCGGVFDLSPLYHHDQNGSCSMHMTEGTSATATLASIADQLSSFSDLQHVDTSFNTDTSSPAADLADQHKSSGGSTVTDATESSVPLQLLRHGESMEEAEPVAVDESAAAFLGDDTKGRLMRSCDVQDGKSLLLNATSSSCNNELSLNMNMPTDQHSIWPVHPTSGLNMMNEIMLLEPHHVGNMWNAHATASSRAWQDSLIMHPALAPTPAAAGGVL